MALTNLSGKGILYPQLRNQTLTSPAMSNLQTMNASGEKVAYIGRVYNKDRASKTITGIGIQIGAVTKDGSTDLEVSLQDPDATTGDPDGVKDQTGTLGNANLTSGWHNITLGATRAVTFGELVAVVFEVTPFGGGNSVVIRTIIDWYGYPEMGENYVDFYTASWAKQAFWFPNFIFIFSDSTYGGLINSTSISNIGNYAFNNTDDPDAYGLAFQMPFKFGLDGISVRANLTQPCELRLYDNNGDLMANSTVAIDPDIQVGGGIQTFEIIFPAQQTCEANTEYRAILVPTTGSDITLYYMLFNDANYKQAMPGGVDFSVVEKSVAGAFAKTTTRNMLMGLIIGAVNVGGDPGSEGILRPPLLQGVIQT